MNYNSKMLIAPLTVASVVAMGGVAANAAVHHTDSQRAIASTTKDVVVRTSSSRTESSAGGVWTTVASATLPTGSWVVAFHASIVNFGPSDYARCTIFSGSTDLGGSAALVGDPSKAGAQGPGALVATVSNAGAVRLSSPQLVALRCEHDHSVAAGAPYIDTGASIIAHKSPSLATLLE